MSSVDERLDQLWAKGPVRGDAAPLRELAAAEHHHPRIHELRAFAVIATLLCGDQAGDLVGDMPLADDVDQDAIGRALGHAAEAWRAAMAQLTEEAADALEAMSNALSDVDQQVPPDPRRIAVHGIADLCIANCSAIAGDMDTARSRLDALLRTAQVPAGLKLAGQMDMAIKTRLALGDANLALRRLDRAAELAAELGADHERDSAETYAGLILLTAGQRAQAERRLTRVLATEHPLEPAANLARSLLASSDSGDEGFTRLAQGLRRAAAQNDLVGYVLMVTMGARMFFERGEHLDAIDTLSTAAAQLDRMDPTGSLSKGLRAERTRLGESLGRERYEQILQEIDRRLEATMAAVRNQEPS